LSPWQVMQLRSYSARPASTALDAFVVPSSAASARGANVE
jgi:hypothetical protein